jgi:chromosome partitioning protein
MIITMANTKGGSGKTTVMRTLVGHAAYLGRPVTILDCDTSENASRWKQLSLAANIWPDNIELVSVDTPADLLEIAPNLNTPGTLIFIDLEGTTNEYFGAGLYVADRIICPVKLSGDELFGAFTLHSSVMEELRRQRGSEPPITVVLTDHDMIDRRARKMKEFWELLAEGGMKVAAATLPARKVYKAMQLGGTLYTIPNPDPKAIADGAALYGELFAEFATAQAAE